jgi:hypothetical protein
MKFIIVLASFVVSSGVWACDLCAVYRAADANGENGKGFVFSMAEQFIPYRTSQFEGDVVHPATPDFVDSSITHLVPGYNFSSWLGISLSVPVTYLKFRRTDLDYSLTAPPVLSTERGTEFGLGDMALIGRVAVLQKSTMEYGVVVNILGGVKFPTGDADRLKDEVDQAKLFESLLPPGTPHDPLGHSISSVHQHNLALGSGSYDGIFGLTANARWQRWFFNGQFQYYLRTKGEAGFEYGDELMVSGGPGVFALLNRSYTLSLQANVVYDTIARDELLGQLSNQTGLTAWYLGPLLNFTWGSRFSANLGVDVPLRIENHGYQSVPDYRLHGGLSWRF